MDGRDEAKHPQAPGASADEPAPAGRAAGGPQAAAGQEAGTRGSEAVLVYVTAANAGEARRIGRKAVEQRLAACANVYPHIDSFYWWQGELVEDHEAVVILKTRRARVPELIAAVRAWHSYTVPAILVLEVRDGNPDYLRWLEEETGGGRPGAGV
ncbi:MAG TPA: divalent-cation tolerance protein CutA [Thermaerobacter sp.]